MSDSTTTGVRAAVLAALALILAAGCHGRGHEEPARQVDSAVFTLDLPAHFGAPERTLVEFDHEVHTEALGELDSCSSCHTVAEGELDPRITGHENIRDLDSALDVYHDLCMGCHEERAGSDQETGPTSACGECHTKQPPAVGARRPMRFDLSLHQRHVIAENNRCDGCHHHYDEQSHELVHREGAETSCDDCHGQRAQVSELGDRQVKVRSLRDAAHEQCVSCHRQRRGDGLETGPERCTGCHSAEAQEAFEVLENPPRLQRGQPDLRWILADGATSKLVPFNHLSHEYAVNRCSTCHHETMESCDECHTLDGSPEGGGVTLEEAYHDPESIHSCVGCHEHEVVSDPDCSGCHYAIGPAPLESSCDNCHSGPRPSLAKLTQPQAVTAVAAPLPPASEDFPTTVVIDSLADQYGPSKLPHRDIVEAMAGGMRNSTLAQVFHSGEPAPCAGCHHHSPVGTRPPPCRACHTNTPDPTRDSPVLTAAYHRQCIGCHQKMGLETGCTVCHAEAPSSSRRGQQ